MGSSALPVGGTRGVVGIALQALKRLANIVRPAGRETPKRRFYSSAGLGFWRNPFVAGSLSCGCMIHRFVMLPFLSRPAGHSHPGGQVGTLFR